MILKSHFQVQDVREAVQKRLQGCDLAEYDGVMLAKLEEEGDYVARFFKHVFELPGPQVRKVTVAGEVATRV